LAAVFGGYQAYQILTSDASPAEKTRSIAGLITGTLGTYALGALGAAAGSFIMPGIGTVLGGAGGAALGWAAGSWIGEKAADWLFGATGVDVPEDVRAGYLGQYGPPAGNPRGKSGGQGSRTGSAIQNQYKGWQNPRSPVSGMKNKAKKAPALQFGKEPPKALPIDPNYRKKWMARNSWLKSTGADPEPYVTAGPENYGKELSSTERYQKYGTFHPTSQEMFNKDNPPTVVAPSISQAQHTHLNLSGTPNLSHNQTTWKSLAEIRN
jgi:hypothetical protein